MIGSVFGSTLVQNLTPGDEQVSFSGSVWVRVRVRVIGLVLGSGKKQ